MYLTLNNKEMELNFGIRFLREVDKRTERTIVTNGYEQKFSEGLAYYLPQIMMGNPVALSTILDCALWKNKGKYKPSDIDELLDNLSEEDYENLFDSVLKELEESNGSKKLVVMMKKELEKQMK